MRQIMKGILLLYLTAASAKDIRKKTVSRNTALLFGFLAAALHIAADRNWEWIAGAAPGALLLGTAWLTAEAVGYGDGCVLIVAGLYLGGKAAVSLLLTGLLLLCPVSLALLVWKKDRKRTLPFVPFLLAAYLLWLLL